MFLPLQSLDFSFQILYSFSDVASEFIQRVNLLAFF